MLQPGARPQRRRSSRPFSTTAAPYVSIIRLRAAGPLIVTELRAKGELQNCREWIECPWTVLRRSRRRRLLSMQINLSGMGDPRSNLKASGAPPSRSSSSEISGFMMSSTQVRGRVGPSRPGDLPPLSGELWVVWWGVAPPNNPYSFRFWAGGRHERPVRLPWEPGFNGRAAPGDFN